MQSGESICVADRYTVMQGLKLLADPYEVAMPEGVNPHPLVATWPASGVPGCVFDFQDWYDLTQFLRLLLQYDRIYVDQALYGSVVEKLTSEKSLRANPFHKYAFLLEDVPDGIFKTMERNCRLLYRLLIEGKVLNPGNVENSVNVERVFSRYPHAVALKDAIVNCFEAKSGDNFLWAIKAHINQPRSDLYLSPPVQPYYDLFCGDIEVGDTPSIINDIFLSLQNLSNSIGKELNKFRSSFPVAYEVYVPFSITLVLKTAGGRDRIVDSLIEWRSKFNALRATLCQLNHIVSDTRLSFAKRLKAKRDIDKILEEACREVEDAELMSIFSWRNFLLDLFTGAPNIAVDGVSGGTQIYQSVLRLLLKYPMDLLAYAIRNRRLAYIPAVRRSMIHQPSFYTSFYECYGVDFELNATALGKYLNTDYINPYVKNAFNKYIAELK